ncbi:MAG: nucleoside triphosphate pyrophosphatase [Acidimicrobiales bacterium]
MRPLVLASASRYRAELLTGAGLVFTVARPTFDERALDHRFDEVGAAGLALELASGKARSVAAAHPDALVIGGDQLAVLTVDGVDRLLHQPGDAARAVEQLMEMSGTTHRLVNGLVVLDTSTGREHAEVDEHRITMRDFTRAEAEAYVEAFEPFDCAGGYRLEDDADLVASVDGEHPSGVIGLNLPSLRRLLGAAGGSLP